MKFSVIYCKGALVYLLSLILYYTAVAKLWFSFSPHWIWGLYLSPIFVIFVSLSTFFYIQMELEEKSRSDSEEDFCLTMVILTLMLIWWPIFLIIYFQVFYQVLIPFEPIEATLSNVTHIPYENENYTALLFNLTDFSEIYGYGCLSDMAEASSVATPHPYKFYEFSAQTIQLKLPSWFCSPQPDLLNKTIYASQGQYFDNQLNKNFRIIVNHYPNYVSEPLLVGFLATVFQSACIFTSVLILSVLLIMAQQHTESSIRKPSTKRRTGLFLLSLAIYVTMISTNQPYFILANFLMGLLFFMASLSSRIHGRFLYLLKQLMRLAKSITFRLLLAVASIILSCFYISFAIIAAQCVFHFKIFLGRHFVALWYNQPEEPLEQYDQFVNKLMLFTWTSDLINLVLAFALPTPVPQKIILTTLIVIQLSGLIIVLLQRPSGGKFLQNQWILFYTQYKVVQQTEFDQVVQDNKIRSVKEVELEFQM